MSVVVEDVYKVTALAHSKLRNELGFVGIEAWPSEKRVYVKLVRQWSMDDINSIATEITNLYKAFQWHNTLIAQSAGEYIISALKREGLPITVITTQKLVKDPQMLLDVKVMDKIEMTEFLRKLKMNGQIRFPEFPTDNMKKLEREIPFFAKHTTEAGSVDYYAPGVEPDDLVTALMMNCFGARNHIGEGNDVGPAVVGPLGLIRGPNAGGIIPNIETRDLVFQGLPSDFLNTV